MRESKVVALLKKYDFSFFAIALIIFSIGLINLYSAVHSSTKIELSNLYMMQLFWFSFSIVIGLVVSFIHPKLFFRLSYLAYAVNILLLLLVLFLGHQGMGAQRWLVVGAIRMQPSEFMKISVVLALARWFIRSNPDSELGIKNLFIPFLIAFVPALLIIAEPDLGTGLLILLVFFVMAFYRRLRWKSIFVVAIIGLLSGSLLYKFGLKRYQQQRIYTFLNPAADSKGMGYNAIQSKIAIGSGQFFGKGILKSSQASLNYLPENHTDFVFSVFNEEHGFFGSVILIALYLALFFRFIWLATSVPKFFNALVAIGLMSIFFWHTLINMGMVMGLLPIVGLPLPLMSYGGSSLLTFCVCCGMATSISNSRNIF
ncbi:MAG: rod shape-determining protein RodA [Bdellovibrionales bacterium]|jgi:rod shape determining protein RodA|nr:rod shape-determining protein RodA [Bdellovibrionales bacterium]MBT3526562.1 rod shape-determining protein RodA [Bdellovibrionales bacterium]MBT7767949.1 rod shape-determining protein RodA [Bdellovibrionales bacterium]